MPLAFPSHQGLILPLWRRWPRRFDGLALTVGAAMPDIVDAAAWPFRGQLGQWMGHSLIGTLVCVPAGLLVAWIVRRVAPERWTARFDQGSIARATASMAIGSLSHVASDFVTHANLLLLWPWYENDRFFPAWWSHAWTAVNVPVYREPYPIAPHTVVWAVLSIVGAVLFTVCVRRR
jgi:hypothetical protein